MHNLIVSRALGLATCQRPLQSSRAAPVSCGCVSRVQISASKYSILKELKTNQKAFMSSTSFFKGIFWIWAGLKGFIMDLQAAAIQLDDSFRGHCWSPGTTEFCVFFSKLDPDTSHDNGDQSKDKEEEVSWRDQATDHEIGTNLKEKEQLLPLKEKFSRIIVIQERQENSMDWGPFFSLS